MDIRIEGDPTSWTLAAPADPGQVAASSGPVALEISEPLAGRMLLSPRSAGSVVFLQPAASPHHGVVPNGVRLPEQCLYVSSATGPDPHSNPPRYYVLPRSADLAALEAQITAAMGEGTVRSWTSPARRTPASWSSTVPRSPSWCSARPLPELNRPAGRLAGRWALRRRRPVRWPQGQPEVSPAAGVMGHRVAGAGGVCVAEQRTGVRRARQDGRFCPHGRAPLGEHQRVKTGRLAGGERAERGLRVVLVQLHHGLESIAVAGSARGTGLTDSPERTGNPTGRAGRTTSCFVLASKP